MVPTDWLPDGTTLNDTQAMLAATGDNTLFEEAFVRNVLLVSPSTLLFVVRTVAHLWRQEQQTRNAQDIARRGAELYDKFVGFSEDLLKVGDAPARPVAMVYFVGE